MTKNYKSLKIISFAILLQLLQINFSETSAIEDSCQIEQISLAGTNYHPDRIGYCELVKKDKSGKLVTMKVVDRDMVILEKQFGFQVNQSSLEKTGKFQAFVGISHLNPEDVLDQKDIETTKDKNVSVIRNFIHITKDKSLLKGIKVLNKMAYFIDTKEADFFTLKGQLNKQYLEPMNRVNISKLDLQKGEMEVEKILKTKFLGKDFIKQVKFVTRAAIYNHQQDSWEGEIISDEETRKNYKQIAELFDSELGAPAFTFVQSIKWDPHNIEAKAINGMGILSNFYVRDGKILVVAYNILSLKKSGLVTLILKCGADALVEKNSLREMGASIDGIRKWTGKVIKMLQ